MQIVDSHSQSIAKLETQLGQLAIAISKREEGKLPSYSIENPKNQQFEQLKAVMLLRGGKEVENKVSEKRKDQRLMRLTMKMRIIRPLLPMCLTPLWHTSQRFLTLKLWMHHSLLRKANIAQTY